MVCLDTDERSIGVQGEEINKTQGRNVMSSSN